MQDQTLNQKCQINLMLTKKAIEQRMVRVNHRWIWTHVSQSDLPTWTLLQYHTWGQYYKGKDTRCMQMRILSGRQRPGLTMEVNVGASEGDLPEGIIMNGAVVGAGDGDEADGSHIDAMDHLIVQSVIEISLMK